MLNEYPLQRMQDARQRMQDARTCLRPEGFTPALVAWPPSQPPASTETPRCPQTVARLSPPRHLPPRYFDILSPGARDLPTQLPREMSSSSLWLAVMISGISPHLNDCRQTEQDDVH
jgi:hypothetical protein